VNRIVIEKCGPGTTSANLLCRVEEEKAFGCLRDDERYRQVTKKLKSSVE
jgi:hypothetical protein